MANLIESHKNRSLNNLKRQDTGVLKPKLQILCDPVKRRPRVRNLFAGQSHGKNEKEELRALMRKPADKVRQKLDLGHNRHPLMHRSKELVGNGLDVGNVPNKVRDLLRDEMIDRWLRDFQLGADERLGVKEALGEEVGRDGLRGTMMKDIVLWAWLRCLGCK